MAIPTGRTSDDVESLDQTEVFELLGNDRRRNALHHLMAIDGGTDIRSLSRQLAAWETGKAVDDVSAEERRRVYISLHQTHLPRLDDAGLLEYESSGDVLELTDRSDDLRVYMEVVPRDEIPWSVFYFGLSVLSVVILLASMAGISPFASLQGLGVGAIVVALFAIASAAHVVVSRRRKLGSTERPPEVA